MKLHMIHHGELLEFDTLTVHIEVLQYGSEYSCPQEEDKWVKFCKEHHFDPISDYDSKIYKLYLELCSEGMY